MPYSRWNISWLSFYRIDRDVSHPFPSHELETLPGSVPSWLSVLVFDGSNSCTNAWIWWRTSEQLKMTSPNSVASWTRRLTLKSHSDNTVWFRLISEQHINVWAKHMIQCASWLWMATFVASILLAALSDVYTMLLYWLHDHKYHCIWSHNIIYIH